MLFQATYLIKCLLLKLCQLEFEEIGRYPKQAREKQRDDEGKRGTEGKKV